MNNLINYLKWRGDLGFDISPLNEVDALIFSELVYLDFSGYTEKSQLPLSDINKLYFKEKRDVVFKDYYVIKDFYNTVGKEITKLLSESAKSNRLKNIYVSDFAAYDCEDNPMQFGACTFHFDTDKLLNRPVLVAVSNTSGLAGIAHWMNTYYRLKGDKAVDKKSPLVEEVKKWVDKEYETGRVTAITDSELEKVIKESSEKLGINF